MTRTALVTSEPLRRKMAGIGLRYLEMARRLPEAGCDVVLVGPPPAHGDEPLSKERDGLDSVELRTFESGSLARLVDDCDAVVAQGQLANDVVLELERLPVVIDLYDPWLIENFSYYRELGLDPWRNDHASWILQMTRGDYFLCSSEQQRRFYLGFLTAVGRVHPRLVETDPDLRALIDVVPFGVPDQLPDHRPWLDDEPSANRRHRLLFGGLYDWYDPVTVLDALERLDRDDVELLIVHNPNSDATPQRLLGDVVRWVEARGERARRLVRMIDWVPSDRRYDLLRDVDLLVSTHRSGLETDLSLRTRFLDAMCAECPMIMTEGGALSSAVRERAAGWCVPPGDAGAVAGAIDAVLSGGRPVAERVEAARELSREYAWPKVLTPLIEFLRSPRRDMTRHDFAAPLPTRAPRDGLFFRARRRLRRWRRGSGLEAGGAG